MHRCRQLYEWHAVWQMRFCGSHVEVSCELLLYLMIMIESKWTTMHRCLQLCEWHAVWRMRFCGSREMRYNNVLWAILPWNVIKSNEWPSCINISINDGKEMMPCSVTPLWLAIVMLYRTFVSQAWWQRSNTNDRVHYVSSSEKDAMLRDR